MNFVEKVKTLQNYFNLGNFKKVIEGCKLLNKKFPNNSFVLNLSGMAYQNLLIHNKAIDFFELALKADNLNIAAMNNLANSLKVTDQFVRADKIFQQILKEDPNAKFIHIHRNPVKSIGSLSSLTMSVRSGLSNKIDCKIPLFTLI